MSACEIIVNPTDITRLDLVIPAEQHFYLKAATAQERQQWLVALGSAKASLSSRRRKDSAAASPDVLKTKKSELRLYCDLLMQQVHKVKSAATNETPPTAESLDDATSLLEATCDTFIKTLDECMQLADANFYQLPQQLITNSPIVTPPLPIPTNTAGNIGRKYSTTRSSFQRSLSSDRENLDVVMNNSPVPTTTVEKSEDCAGASAANEATETASDDEDKWLDTFDHENNNQSQNNNPENKPAIDTFFSTLEISFLNLKIGDDDGIPTLHFLKSCAVVITIFDLFGSPIFAPLKFDVDGNLRKLTGKYKKNTSKFLNLQDIVKYEMEVNETTAKNSGTDALLWLKRGLEFVYEFLTEFSTGNPDLKNCALNAYNRTLKQYHGWLVRSVISAATHTVPSRQEVLSKLALHPDDTTNPLYELQVKEDARLYLKAMKDIISILNRFYSEHNLDKKEVV
ncbi:Pleckstrin y domain-containing A member 8 [Chamberlinius hualienensis]